MEHIWAPWRMEYIQMEKREGCILCEIPKQDNDAANHVLYRGENNFVVLNTYPYNPGHLMIVPYHHVNSLEGLTDDELHEHIDTVRRSISVLREVFNPAGFNLGMNLGKVSGAGVADHLHLHIVPRWTGDTNFMPILAETKLVSVGLKQTYRRLKKESKKFTKRPPK